MKHPNQGGEFGVYQEKVGLSIVALIIGSIICIGCVIAGINLEDRLWLYGGLAVGIVALVYFAICVLSTIAAGVDYVKLIADNQTASIIKKSAPAKTGSPDIPSLRKLGKAIEEE